MFRPDIKILPTASDKILLSLTVYLTIVLFVINGMEWLLHQNISEAFLTKHKMLFLSGFGIIVAWGGHVLSKHPQYFNYRVEITEENAAFQYQKTIRAVRWLLIIILTALVGISLQHFYKRITLMASLSGYFMYFSAIIALCYMLYVYLYFKAKRADAKA